MSLSLHMSVLHMSLSLHMSALQSLFLQKSLLHISLDIPLLHTSSDLLLHMSVLHILGVEAT